MINNPFDTVKSCLVFLKVGVLFIGLLLVLVFFSCADPLSPDYTFGDEITMDFENTRWRINNPADEFLVAIEMQDVSVCWFRVVFKDTSTWQITVEKKHKYSSIYAEVINVDNWNYEDILCYGSECTDFSDLSSNNKSLIFGVLAGEPYYFEINDSGTSYQNTVMLTFKRQKTAYEDAAIKP